MAKELVITAKTVEEAIELDNFYKVDKVIYLKGDYKILVERVKKRRICPDCGTITTTDVAPDDICPSCQAKLIIRADDTEFVYKTRYSVFENQTLPIVDYFKSKNKLVTIDANQSSEKVYNNVLKEIGKKKNEILENY